MDADFVARARGAGYTDAEIEQHLAMSGVAPKAVRALLGPRQVDPMAAIGAGIRQLLGTEEAGPPQAMTRVTHTPVRWGEPAQAGAFGTYNPATGAITMSAEKLPQWNANDEYLGNVLRHEQVHALIAPDSRQQIEAYFDAHPELATTGRANLARYDADAAATNRGLATEAPAYAVMGYRFGMPESTVQAYRDRMPAGARIRYDQLMRSK